MNKLLCVKGSVCKSSVCKGVRVKLLCVRVCTAFVCVNASVYKRCCIEASLCKSLFYEQASMRKSVCV